MDRQKKQQLLSQALETACAALGVQAEQITHLEAMKLGMTNHSFVFTLGGQRYMLRLPGEGTAKLIDRQGEAAVYQAIAGLEIADDVVYLDPATGVKITSFLEGVRTCDVSNWSEIARCMSFLRAFHEKKLTAERSFDLFAMIEFYESLWNGTPSVYQDYAQIKAQVLALRPYLDLTAKPYILSHLDTVPDNFLLAPENSSGRTIRLIDWEYAAMQDPDVDIAMFAVYGLPAQRDADRLIDCYYVEGCSESVRIKIYAYMAVCGLLWSNWCEYKHQLGVEFRGYAQQQYRCAADYSALALERLKQLEGSLYEHHGR